MADALADPLADANKMVAGVPEEVDKYMNTAAMEHAQLGDTAKAAVRLFVFALGCTRRGLGWGAHVYVRRSTAGSRLPLSLTRALPRVFAHLPHLHTFDYFAPRHILPDRSIIPSVRRFTVLLLLRPPS